MMDSHNALEYVMTPAVTYTVVVVYSNRGEPRCWGGKLLLLLLTLLCYVLRGEDDYRPGPIVKQVLRDARTASKQYIGLQNLVSSLVMFLNYLIFINDICA